MQMSRVNGCVIALDWYLPRTFFRSVVSGAGVLMYALFYYTLPHKKDVTANIYFFPLVTEQYTTCSNTVFVLLKTGIMMPETC